MIHLHITQNLLVHNASTRFRDFSTNESTNTNTNMNNIYEQLFCVFLVCLSNNYIRCYDGSRICEDQVCDGIAQCSNGEDELNCSGPESETDSDSKPGNI